MTTKELIEKLQEVDPDGNARVCYTDCARNLETITEVYTDIDLENNELIIWVM